MFWEILAQFLMIIFAFWIVDGILLAIFGIKWRRTMKKEKEWEKRQPPRFGS